MRLLSHLARRPISCRPSCPTPRSILWPPCQARPPFPLLFSESSRCPSKVRDGWPCACSNRKYNARLPPFVIESVKQGPGRRATCQRGENCTIGGSICTSAWSVCCRRVFPGPNHQVANRVLGACPGVYADEKTHRAIGSNLPGGFCAEGTRWRVRQRSRRSGWRWTHSRSRSCSREGFQAGTRCQQHSCRDGEPRCRGQERSSGCSAR